uniref:Polyprotein n=1 Tax=Corymbium villosum cheravirus TaxID=3115783 RepID=A0AAT9JAR7_9SECO
MIILSKREFRRPSDGRCFHTLPKGANAFVIGGSRSNGAARPIRLVVAKPQVLPPRETAPKVVGPPTKRTTPGPVLTRRATQAVYDSQLAAVCKEFSCTPSEGKCILSTLRSRAKPYAALRRHKKAVAEHQKKILLARAAAAQVQADLKAKARVAAWAKRYSARLKARIEGNSSNLTFSEEFRLKSNILLDRLAANRQSAFFRSLKAEKRAAKRMAQQLYLEEICKISSDPLQFVERAKGVVAPKRLPRSQGKRVAILDSLFSTIGGGDATGEFSFLGYNLVDEVGAKKFLVELLHFRTVLGVPVYQLESRDPWVVAPVDTMACIDYYWHLYVVHSYDHIAIATPRSANIASGIAYGNGPWNIMSPVVTCLVDWCKMSFFSNLVDKTKEALEGVLSSFFSRLGSLTSMFWEFVDFLKKRVKDLLDEHWFAVTVASGLVLSFCTFVAILIAVGMFCKLVSWIGFGPAAVTSLIACLGGAFLGVYGLLNFYDKSWDDMLAKIVNFFCASAVVQETQSEEAVGNAIGDLFSPFWWLLTKLVPAVQLQKAGPIIGAGQLGNSLGGITKLCTTFKEFGSSFLDYLSRIADTMCDYSGGAIRSINLVLSEDFTSWCDEVEKYATDTYESLIVTRLFRLKKLRGLKDREKAFHLIFLDPAKKMPTAAVHMFEKARQQLNEALRTIGVCKYLDAPCCTPFSLWLYSAESGTGKSTAQKRLMDTLLDTAGYPQFCRHYQRGTGLKFWDNYEHQAVCAFDDLSASIVTELDWFQVITDDRVPISMAEIGKKGTIFTSDFVVASSNMLSHRPDSEIGSSGAFDNRRHLLLEVRRNPAYAPGKGCKSFSQYAIRHPTASGYPYMDKSMNVSSEAVWYDEEVINDVLYTSWVAHSQKCEQATANGRDIFFDETQAKQHNVLDFFFLLHKKLNDGLLTEDQYDTLCLLIENIEDYNPVTGFSLKQEVLCGDQIFRFKLQDMISNIDDLLPESILHECLSFLPYQVKGPFYKAILEKDDFPFTVSSLYSPFELYIFHRLRKAKSMSLGGTHKGFLENVNIYRGKLKELYNKVLEKAPFYLKICLSVGFFFLFGYGFYLACKQLTNACTGIAGLGACLAAGNAAGASLQKSGDMSTKSKEKAQNVQYVRGVIPSGFTRFGFSAGSWAQESEEAFGNGPTEEHRREAIDAFEHINPYVCSIVRNVLDASGQKSIFKGYILGGRTVLFVKHVWDFHVVSGLYTFCRNGMETKFNMVKSYVKTLPIEGKDLIMVGLPSCIPESDDGGFKMLCKDDTDIPRVGPAYCFSPEYLDGRVMNVAKLFSNFYDCQKFERYNVGSQIIPVTPGCSYKSDLSFADCGSVVFFAGKQKEGSKPIPALMHVADGKLSGDASRTGVGLFLTQTDCALWRRLSPTVAHGNGPPLISTGGPLQEPCVKELGKVDISRCPHVSGKSQLVPSLVSSIVEVPNNTAPAVLSQEDKRIASSTTPEFDVFRDGMRKYAHMAGPMVLDEPECEQDFYECFDDIFEDLVAFKEEPEEDRELLIRQALSLQVVSEDVALNGKAGEQYFDAVTSGTSEGYPWTLSRPKDCKGKGWLLDGAPGAWSLDKNSEFGKSFHSLETSYRSGENPVLVGVDHPKDETVMLDKCEKNLKTRLFTVLPFEYNLLVRKYFLEFVVFYMRQHNRCPGKVGINPVGIEWQVFYEKLRAMGVNWFNGDFKRFDGITPRDVLERLVYCINKMYVAESPQELLLDNRVRKSLLLAASDRLGIAGRNLFKVNSGIPSGFALTVIINSLVNEFFLRYAWKRIVRKELKPEYVPRSVFSRHVCFGVYGDDNLVSVSDAAKDFYNLITISSFLSQFGVTLVNGQCKDQTDFPPFSPNLTDCDFLKRRMVVSPDTGRVLAPLAVSSIYNRLHWIRDCNDRGAATLENCESALYESYHHGREFFYDLRRKIVSSLQKASICTLELPTYEACEARFLCEKRTHRDEPDVPIRTIVATDMAHCLGHGVWLAGVCVASSFFAGKYTVWCGTTPIKKAFIRFSLVSSSNGGYLSRFAYIENFKKFNSADKEVVFLSSDGLSHAVPPALLYLLRIKRIGESKVNGMRAMCEKDGGSPNPAWSRILDGYEDGINILSDIDSPTHLSQYIGGRAVVVPHPIGNADRPSCLFHVKSHMARIRDTCVRPTLLEWTGFSFKTGAPGAAYKHMCDSSLWERYAGERARIVSCVGLVCHTKCPGHWVEFSSQVQVVEVGEERFDLGLYGSMPHYENFVKFSGKWADDPTLNEKIRRPCLRAFDQLVKQACVNMEL